MVKGGMAMKEVDEPNVAALMAQCTTHSKIHVSFEVPAAGNLSWAYHQAMPCQTNRKMLEGERAQG